MKCFTPEVEILKLTFKFLDWQLKFGLLDEIDINQMIKSLRELFPAWTQDNYTELNTPTSF